MREGLFLSVKGSKCEKVDVSCKGSKCEKVDVSCKGSKWDKVDVSEVEKANVRGLMSLWQRKLM